MTLELRRASRSLLLPILSIEENRLVEIMGECLNDAEIFEDQSNWIDLQIRTWQNTGKPTPEFKSFIKSVIYSENRDEKSLIFRAPAGPHGDYYLQASKLLSKKYFDIHKSLLARFILSHEEARLALSHSALIAALAIDAMMSASEICRLIIIKDTRFPANWKVVEYILNALKLSRSLSVQDITEIYDKDSEIEPSIFGDMDIYGCIEHCAEVGRSLGFGEKFAIWLNDLINNDLHEPYLLILHYQLSIQAKYDHAVTYAYEFSPRGLAAGWLTDKYNIAGIGVAKSAFLNNAKATLRFDEVWVAGREDHQRSAAALAGILKAIESSGPSAKAEISAQIRALLHRYIRIKADGRDGEIAHRLVPLGQPEFERLLEAIGRANSKTTGILEQRLVDCFGVFSYRQENGWSPKGIGDSVFAANVFRKKFGDIEFELPVRPRPEINAFESHGGNLTLPYILDHLDSFKTVLSLRKEELEAISPLEQWKFSVTFIAHGFVGNIPENIIVSNILVTIKCLTFEEVCRNLIDARAIDFANQFIICRLNDIYVHEKIRASIFRLMHEE